MIVERTLDSSFPDWVIEHPETLAVFQNLGIDYCYGGKSLEFACREQGLNADAVLKSLRRCVRVVVAMPPSLRPRHADQSANWKALGFSLPCWREPAKKTPECPDTQHA